MRGDYGGRGGAPTRVAGPSPRAWGLQALAEGPELLFRAIPTCVGTTGWLRENAPGSSGHPHVRGDYALDHPVHGLIAGHPHVRGDYFRLRGQADLPLGPSPRAWGLPYHPQVPHPGPRAIPTCVGTTSSLFPSRGTEPGHPHVRGDYSGSTHSPVTGCGPSPRAWGLHLTRTAKIPAYPPLCIFSGEVPGRGFQVPPRRGKG